MTRRSIVDELESAADRIADMSRPDLQIILRRASLMLRNVSGVPLESTTADTLDSIAAEMKISRSDLIQIVLREWLETNAYLPVRTIDEESEIGGSA
ncbi:ribbon-helix-helix protein, CopG family [Mesorhizobium sp.]|uniref:ribbon-helix-helix protein, CopG family n=1 Tax=Mesorhizobium sp. TaxID=1871066 RepID=UPI0012099378|nr:ribbon-helix-helix protein, CopG family [Mesorhizobium sp.]TIN77780.1 MAG: ribbon-helix-helix protein, CopG family [Mesorhizobium sp.]